MQTLIQDQACNLKQKCDQWNKCTLLKTAPTIAINIPFSFGSFWCRCPSIGVSHFIQQSLPAGYNWQRRLICEAYEYCRPAFICDGHTRVSCDHMHRRLNARGAPVAHSAWAGEASWLLAARKTCAQEASTQVPVDNC